MNRKLLTTAQLCESLQISRRSLERYRKKGMPFYLVGNKPRFKYEEILEWMRKQATSQTIEDVEDYIFQ